MDHKIVTTAFTIDGYKISKNLGINSFPTNFLIDEKGKIIKRNISLTELKDFLLRFFSSGSLIYIS